MTKLKGILVAKVMVKMRYLSIAKEKQILVAKMKEISVTKLVAKYHLLLHILLACS